MSLKMPSGETAVVLLVSSVPKLLIRLFAKPFDCASRESDVCKLIAHKSRTFDCFEFEFQ